MDVVILAGGRGQRLAPLTDTRPKPLVDLAGRPVIEYVAQRFVDAGFRRFWIASGYRHEDLANHFSPARCRELGWTVSVVYTGLKTETGGRLRRLRWHLSGQRFFLTYCDCLADVDPLALLAAHENGRRTVTMTTVQPTLPWGTVRMNEDRVCTFMEKPRADFWINGGFFVLEPEILWSLSNDGESLERDVLPRLAAEGRVTAYPHQSFWHPMNTLDERTALESLLTSGQLQMPGAGA
jgi:glucose-1-phosphate cytidylyltransferase